MRLDRTIRRMLWLAALLGLTLGLGCATPNQRAEQRDRARKAVSHLNIGVDHLDNGRTGLALREFMTAEALDPSNAQVQYALGEAYLSRDKRAESEQHFRRALEIHPGYHDARLSLSTFYILEERYEEAIAECDVLLEDPTLPGPWQALANRGWAQHKLDRNSEARRSFELALEYRSDYWPASLSLAILEAEEGRRMEAISLFDHIIALEPGPRVESEVNYRLAELYISLGKRNRAMKHLARSVASSPDGEWARKSEAYLKLLQ